jgi:hypothetical protein
MKDNNEQICKTETVFDMLKIVDSILSSVFERTELTELALISYDSSAVNNTDPFGSFIFSVVLTVAKWSLQRPTMVLLMECSQ